MSESTLFILFVSIIIAAIPTAIFVAIIYWIDRYEKEPLWLLITTFLWGAVPSIIAAFIINTLFSIPFYLVGEGFGDAIGATFIAPLVEESLKGAALLLILFFWRSEIDSLLDGIIYGAMIGLGFGMVEDIFYFVSQYQAGGVEGWTATILLRTMFSLNHALFTGVTGLGIAAAKLTRNNMVKIAAPFLGWCGAVFLHFVHNGAATLAGTLSAAFCFILPINGWGGVLIILIIMIWALRQEQRWIREQLDSEVTGGVLTRDQFDRAQSGRKRFLHSWERFGTHGLGGYLETSRFYHRCSELAYKKVHFEHYHDQQSAALIDKLRGEVATLSRALINPGEN
ncbi:MAG: PrsW family intramembrane metalloprotease [Anaerolineales bacterium]|nr:PrsW family intramembrane metalloprotease [Anaerolineales bacterium]MCB0013669.1 PrsW family intramembrane metalloprotease [Anaerolineales bacterium]MCB0016967.1 PrsW family intramembrane metalloprotease [Anaerolineales bacterium]MCB0031382.1 PrsW family intramembrane metalloprotease [Anaerolineales bacterium]